MTGRRVCLAGMILACVVVPATAEDAIVEATVQGEGISPETAQKDALRKALEQAGKTEIFSQSQVENFQLMKDTIISRAEGLVTDFQVLEKGEGAGGTFFCKIKAKVSKSALATSWGEVQNVLDQIGRPKVMVVITEKIDGRVDDSSILESQIEERLLKSGFDVYASKQLQAINKKEMQDATAENNLAKLAGLAKDFETQIFVVGNGNADAAGVEDIYGTKAAMYNCDAMAKMFYTDTGKLLASESIPVTRRGAQGKVQHSPQAGKAALADAGKMLVEKVYETVMTQWATQISAGAEIRLEVEGLKVAEAIKIKTDLARIQGVERVNYDYTKGVATYRIAAKMTAQELTEHLVAGDWAQRIEILDVKLNRIQATKPGK